MLSLIIPVYKNQDNIEPLLAALEAQAKNCKTGLDQVLEVVFVVDGSPDLSYERLQKSLPTVNFRSQLLALSRNFGAFAAIRAGVEVSKGEFFAVMAADLQEPPDLIYKIFDVLTKLSCDVVVGRRISRDDPFISKLTSGIFWCLYKKLVVKDIAPGGVDIFGCNRPFRDQLLRLDESHSSLVGLIYWLGFRREEVIYVRKPREIGSSSWSFGKKFKYMSDSLFAFTDLPIRLLIILGTLGVLTSAIFGVAVLFAKIFGQITVPGYTAIILAVVFFGGINMLGIGIVGNYTWRAYENTKRRPSSVTLSHSIFN